MKTPARHKLPGSREVIAGLIETAASELVTDLGGDRWTAESTPSSQRTAFDNAMWRAYLDPADPAIRSDLELSACAAAAAHLAAITPGTDPVEVPGPGGRTVEVVRARRPQQLEPPAQWRAGLLAAVITRNARVIELLCTIRVEDLLRITRAPAPPWFELEARALAATCRREVRAPDLLIDAIQNVMSDRVHEASHNWILDIVQPELELSLRILAREQDKIDALLCRAIELHHHYYDHEGKDDYHGQLALAPLAMACLAHDLRLKTAVESDYIPRWLIEDAGAG